jgi:general secretion pathway protein K
MIISRHIRNNPIRNNRGMALLITLGVISVLMITTIELNRRSRHALSAVAVTRDRLVLSEIAASGIHAGMALLAEDKFNDPPSGMDSILEDWADPEILGELAGEITFEGGELEIGITDELGKIQVNTLVKFPGGTGANNPQMFLWDRFLRLIVSAEDVLTDVEPPTIIDSAKDWLDSKDDDAITGLNGAESDYYLGLDPPYECKNGPIDEIEELVLIKGIMPELFYGLEGMFGISNYMTTIFGPLSRGEDPFYTGKININTADLPVIAALLPTGYEILAPEIFAYREALGELEGLSDLSGPNWYKNAPGCSDVNIDANLITTFSDFYQIQCAAAMGTAEVTVTAVIQRKKSTESGKYICKVLSWRTE